MRRMFFVQNDGLCIMLHKSFTVLCNIPGGFVFSYIRPLPPRSRSQAKELYLRYINTKFTFCNNLRAWRAPRSPEKNSKISHSFPKSFSFFLIREITRKLVYNCVMCRGSLAIRWHAERFSKRKSPHKAPLASCLSHLASKSLRWGSAG